MGLLHFLPIAIDLIPRPSLCTIIRTIEGAEIECLKQLKSSVFKSNPQSATVWTCQRGAARLDENQQYLRMQSFR
jgi:hypothetical protein